MKWETKVRLMAGVGVRVEVEVQIQFREGHRDMESDGALQASPNEGDGGPLMV